MEQGSQEWKEARAGSIGASKITDTLAKAGSAGRRNLISRLVCEILTGEPTETYQSWQMAQGIEREPLGRALYEYDKGVTVEEVALIRNPFIPRTHASPDGLVGDEGSLEIKCPEPSAHLFDHILSPTLPPKYVDQCQWLMACTGRDWCDFVSYCPDLSIEHQYYCERIHRDEARIKILSDGATAIHLEVDTVLTQLKEKN
jgi:putative phage-type endonuclease